MIQCVITPAAGKRLIAQAVVHHHAIQSALKDKTVVVVAGTTNGYVAEALLHAIGETEGFSRRRFFRGITTPPGMAKTGDGRLPDESRFPGDVIIVKGKWVRAKTLFDVVDNLTEGDVILKGANAVDLARRQAGILIGHPKGGTILAALQAVVGRRVRLILPAGLEKRVSSDLHSLSARLNVPGAQGNRLLPVPGEVLTEIDALQILTGAAAELMAGGGVLGAEGAVWLFVTGSPEQEQSAKAILTSVEDEPLFSAGWHSGTPY